MAFWLIAAQNKSLKFARWFGVAFFSAVLAVSFQIFDHGAEVWHLGRMFSGFFGISASVVGLCGLLVYYQIRIDYKIVLGFLVLVLCANWFLQFIFTNLLVEKIVIHLPNALIQAVAAYVIFCFGKNKTLERILSFVLLIGACYFLLYPLFGTYLFVFSPTNKEDLILSFDWMWNGAGIIVGVSDGLLMILLFGRDMFASTRIDGLSGLLNRKTFEDEMDNLLSHIKSGRCAGSLVIADFDHFKQINDTYGHGQGDEVIVRFSELLLSCAVGDVIVGRLGGEEFGVFLPECDLVSAEKFAQAICQAYRAEKFDVSGPQLLQSASFGVAEHLIDEPISSLFTRADVALYRAKVMGRNRVCLAASPPTNNGVEHVGIVQKSGAAA